MNRMFSIFFVLIFISTLTGCIVESEQPLSDPETATYDARLEGVWRSILDGDIVYLHFGRGNDNIMDIVKVEHKKQGYIDSNGFTMFPTIIDQMNYMNLRTKDPKEGKGRYVFVKYEIPEENTLNLWLFDTEKIKKLIGNGTIEGKIIKGKYVDTIIMTDTIPNLVKILKSKGQEGLFKIVGRFQKIK